MINNYSTYVLRLTICIFSLFLFQCSDPNIENLYNEEIENIKNAIVEVQGYGLSYNLKKQSNGIVINDKGFVITNYHIFSSCEDFKIMHNKEVIPYKEIIGIDVEKDILIFKIDANKFPALKIANLGELKTEDSVYSIRSMNEVRIISEGKIIGLKNFDKLRKDYIQITSDLTSNNSGEIVINSKGELIGINKLIIRDSIILNFVIPIEDVFKIEIAAYHDKFKDYQLLSKGYNAAESSNYSDAIFFYRQFINKYPKNAIAYYLRGRAKDKLNQYRNSISDYTKAIEINSNNYKFYLNRGAAKYDLGDYKGAMKDFNRCIEINPTDATSHYNRGVTKGLYNYRDAIRDFNKAIELNPLFVEAYSNRGVAKNNLNDYISAIPDFNKAIELDSLFAKAYSGLGAAKYNLKDRVGACIDWEKAAELGDLEASRLLKKYCK